MATYQEMVAVGLRFYLAELARLGGKVEELRQVVNLINLMEEIEENESEPTKK